MQNRARFHFDKEFLQNPVPIGFYEIHQLGDLSCEAGYEVPDHVQGMHEISYVVSGKGDFYANGTRYALQEGAVFLNSKGDIHRIVSSMDMPIRYMYLAFDFREPILDERIKMLSNFLGNPEQRLIYEKSEIQETFIKLLTEILINDPMTSLLKESLITTLLCKIYRLMYTNKTTAYRVTNGQTVDTKSLVYDIARYIDTNVGRIVNLQVLSSEFGYSYTYIARVFNDQMKETLSNYYTKRRFEKARDLLSKGNTVTEVSNKMGYQSIHAFSRAYKKYFGVSPSQMGT